ncbi:MAG TPA: ATP-binding protein [Bacteriovoracaceae bacterium]|nr:ATP-binding protein [Bacteriovoracaceae bacterium]
MTRIENRTSSDLRAEIQGRLGFFPPFFEPAADRPHILANLWAQTVSSYLDNPLPALFKEQLAAILARYCNVPYCLLSHSCTLRPLGMGAKAILNLLMTPTPSIEELRNKTVGGPGREVQFDFENDQAKVDFVLACCVCIYFNVDALSCHEKLRRILSRDNYDDLIVFLAYNRTALTWAEAHPEISHKEDQRVQQNLDALILAEPALRVFFENYLELVQPMTSTISYDVEKKTLLEQIANKSKELKIQQDLAIHNSKFTLLGEMASGIAHEINNPLTIILGSLHVMQSLSKSGLQGGELFKEQITNIGSTTNRIVKIIKGLQLFARDAGDEPRAVASVDKIVTDALSLCQSRFRNNSISLRINATETGNLKLRCRSAQLSQVILSLLNNSFEAVRDKEQKWIELDVSTEASQLRIAVTDSGPGISRDFTTKIFQPFFTTKPPGKGTGLGLSISKGIIEEHSGTIAYDGAHPHTRFIIKLPLTNGVV